MMPRIMAGDCPFCAIVVGDIPAPVVREWPGVLAIRPRRPVTGGHVLVIPHAHIADVGASPAVSALAMSAAAELAAGLDSVNIITSKGSPATQTVGHLHLHVVPRRPDDGLCLPWHPRPADAGGTR